MRLSMHSDAKFLKKSWAGFIIFYASSGLLIKSVFNLCYTLPAPIELSEVENTEILPPTETQIREFLR